VWGKSSPPPTPTPTPNNLPPHSCLPHVKPLGGVACGSRRLRGWCWGGGFPPLTPLPHGALPPLILSERRGAAVGHLRAIR
jgi:hypothetical protein